MKDDVSKEMLKDHVTYAVLRPAARLALEAKVGLREFKKLVELAYYQEAKNRGMKMRDISKTLSISMAKVGLLSKALKEHFIEPELQHGLARQTLALLWAGPLSKIRITNALKGFDEDEIGKALEQLIASKRVGKIEGRAMTTTYELKSEAHRLDRDRWMAKIDGLNTLLDFVGRTVEARFFENDSRATVRNLSFRIRPEDLGKLTEFYEQHLFPLIIELDDLVDEDRVSLPMKLSLLWTVDRENREKSNV